MAGQSPEAALPENASKHESADTSEALVSFAYADMASFFKGLIGKSEPKSITEPRTSKEAMDNHGNLTYAGIALEDGDFNHDGRVTLQELEEKRQRLLEKRAVQYKYYKTTTMDQLGSYDYFVKNFKSLAGSTHQKRNDVIENVDPASIKDEHLQAAFKKVSDDHHKYFEGRKDITIEGLKERSEYFAKMAGILKESRYGLVHGRVEAARSLADGFEESLSKQKLLAPAANFAHKDEAGKEGLLPSLFQKQHEALVSSGASADQVSKSLEMLETLKYLSGPGNNNNSPVSLKEILAYKENQQFQLKGVIDLDKERSLQRLEFEERLAENQLVQSNFDKLSKLSRPDLAPGISRADIKAHSDNLFYKALLFGIRESETKGSLDKSLKQFVSRSGEFHLSLDAMSTESLQNRLNADLGSSSRFQIKVESSGSDLPGLKIMILGKKDGQIKDSLQIEKSFSR